MKHTSTLTTLAAAALAAAVPLAAQAQTSTAPLTIVVGAEPVVEQIITCDNSQGGKLVPFAYPAGAASRKGEVVLFTTDVNESGKPTGVVVQANSTDATGQEPGLNFGWTYGSSTATKFVRLTVQVPLDTIGTTINGQKTPASVAWTTPTDIATSGNAASSHVFLKGLDSLATTGASVTQAWSGNTLTVDIKKGTDALAARAATTTNLDITLQAPAGLHLKALTGGTPVTITWTCSLQSYPTSS
jgi:hypothetical protein